MKITRLDASEILDSRGCPTVKCDIVLSNGFSCSASVPSGKSKGSKEAVELRDWDVRRFQGMGVLSAVGVVRELIAPRIVGLEPDLTVVDGLLIGIDGTLNKSFCGANALLAVSCAVARAAAYARNVKLYEYIAGCAEATPCMPLCMFNLINGGMHARTGGAFQEFMVVPEKQKPFVEALSCVGEVSSSVGSLLAQHQGAVGLGDEGGFVVDHESRSFEDECVLLDLLAAAHERSGVASEPIRFALDIAASHFYDYQKGVYRIKETVYATEEMVGLYAKLALRHDILALEDPLADEDYDGWSFLTKSIGSECLVVGDDLFVTNNELISSGGRLGLANAVIIKPNQAGTITEALVAVRVARSLGLKIIVSHRSGETCDSFIADFAVGVAADYAKFGACARSERVAKYNRLLDIEKNIN